MKTKLKDLPQKDKEALIRGVVLATGSDTRDKFWDRVDELLEQMAARKAPRVEPRLTNAPKRGT